MYYLAGISAVGLLLSLACNVLGWLRVDPPGGPAALYLNVGIFIIWIPLLFLANRTMPRGSSKDNFDHLYAELPQWARAAVMVVGIYAILNFAHFVLMTSRYPKNEVPFFLVVRMFSGVSMVFYGSGVAGFVGLACLARKRGQGEPVSPIQPAVERHPAKHLESALEEHEQSIRGVNRLKDKALDCCNIVAAAVWTLGWLAPACLAAARVAEAVDLAALVGLAVAFLMASIGCLVVLGLVRFCLRNRRAANGAVTADEGDRSKDKVQLEACSTPEPWPRRIISWFVAIIWCGFAIVWNFAWIGAMLGLASEGHGWFMLFLIPWSLIGWLLFLGVFVTVAAVIESLVRILHRASSWL